MRWLVIACGVSALFGGGVGALVVDRLSEPEVQATKPKPKTERARLEAEPDRELLARVDQLESQLANLRRSQQAREALTKYAESLGEEEDAKPADRAKAGKGNVDGADPVFELAVRSVMDRVDWEKDEEKKARRQQRQDERARSQTALLTERLRLDEKQSQEVSAILVRQMERLRELRNRDDDSPGPRPSTRAEWREQVSKVRDQTDAELRGILSEEQMQAYTALAEEEGFGGRGFGRRDRASEQQR